jgi:transposase
MDLQHRLVLGPGPPACRWCPEKGGSTTWWVEDLAVEGEALGRSRGGLTSKIHLAVDGHGLPMSIILTVGQAGDNPQLLPLLDQLNVGRDGPGRPRKRPDRILADKAYSHPSTRTALRRRGIRFTSPERTDQIARRAAKGSGGGRPPGFDPILYAGRNVVERCFNRLKQFRDLATRYAKRAAYYRSELTLAAIVLWCRRSELQDTA